MTMFSLSFVTTFLYFMGVWASILGHNFRTQSDQKAYIGWPLLLTCDELFNNEACWGTYISGNASCTMRFSGETDIIFQSDWFDVTVPPYPLMDYEISNVHENTPDVEILMQDIVNNISCFEYANLTKTVLQDLTCKDALTDWENTLNQTQSEGMTQKLKCEVPEDSTAPTINMTNYDVTWYYNCKTELPDGITTKDQELIIGRLNHTLHPGTYSCSITHEGQRRFITHRRLCIKPDTYLSTIVVACDEHTLYKDEGSTVEVSCQVEVYDRNENSLGYYMSFYPLLGNGTKDESMDNISCVSTLGKNWTVSPHDDRVSCIFSTVRDPTMEDFKCFESIPSESEWEDERNKVTTNLEMKYRITNIASDEFGKFGGFARNEKSKDNDTDYFEILKNCRGCDDKEITWIIGGILGGCLALIVIAIICFVFRLQIEYCWRRSNCVPYAKDVNEFGAYLSYYWDDERVRGIDGPKFVTFIENLTERLEKISCPVYDPSRTLDKYNGAVQSMNRTQRDCDRVIIVLTPDYLEDATGDITRFTNFLDCKFVFIKSPKVEKSLEKIDEDRRRPLEAQLRRSRVINWDGKGELSRKFVMEITLAMPNRRSEVSLAKQI